MKTILRSSIRVLVLLGMIILVSCEKKEPKASDATGKVQFSFSRSSAEATARLVGTDTMQVSYQLMISVEDMSGNAVLTDKLVPLYTFGSGFMSDNVELKAGQYNLTKFLIIDLYGTVVYASPVEGSPLGYLTKDPLPVKFSIAADKVTSVVPEVLAADNHSPGDFGYASFGVQIIDPLHCYVICYLDNPILMAPTKITDARLTVTSADGWSYTFALKAEVNHLIIRGGSEYYTFVVQKEGYDTQTYTFTIYDLKNTSAENPLGLKIPWGPQYKILTIQPGPDDGKDAMISNLEPDRNFGDYQYFEATFLTEPVLTVMRSNRSLIMFNLDSLPKSAVIKKVTLELHFDLPVPVDSTFFVTDPNTGVCKYSAVFQTVIQPWEEHKITWNNQPGTSEMGQVYLYPFIRNANFVDIDVTSLYNNPSASLLPFYGIMFRQWPDESFPGFRFVSSDYPEAPMRPKLVVEYTE